MEITKIEENYYNVGTIQDLVISQSALKEIDPLKNGSPRKFKEFFTGEKKETPAMLRGTIFHKWAEDPEAFVVSSAVKPPEKLGLVADYMINCYEALEDIQSKSEYMMMIDKHFLQACRFIGWNNTYKEETIIKNVGPVADYFAAVYDPANEGKIILTATLKEQIEKCIDSLKRNEYANRLLFWKNDFAEIEYHKEIELFWTEIVDGREYKMKGKLDDLVFDHEKKETNINDLKTTGGSAYNFEPTFINYGLDIQFATYARGIDAKYPQYSQYKKNFRNIVVETGGLFQTVVHRWHPGLIGPAYFKIDELLRRVGSAIDNDFTMSLEEVRGKGEIRHSELTVK